MSTTPIITDLEPEILLRVLVFCDVYTILSVSCVNRELRSIALAKQLWISAINHLRNRALMETWPSYDPTHYTAEELIEQVRRLVVGPRTWMSPSPSEPISAQVVAEFSLPSEIQCPNTEAGCRVQLINGGRHILLAHLKAVELWDLAAKQCLWNRPHYVDSLAVSREVEGNTVSLAMLSDNARTLEVLRIDLTAGNINQNLVVRLETSGHLSANALLGDLLAVHLTGGILLVNWRSEMYVLLGGLEQLDPLPPRVSLVAGHIVLLRAIRSLPAAFGNEGSSSWPNGVWLFLYSTVDLASDWRPVGDYSSASGCVSIRDLTPTVAERQQLDNQPLSLSLNGRLTLSVHENPVRPGAYRINVYAAQRRPRGACRGPHPAPGRGPCAALFRYNFVASASDDLPSSFIGFARRALFMTLDVIAYSEYSVQSWTNAITSVVRTPNATNGQLVAAPNDCLGRDLSPYNCIVTTLTPSSVVLSYYL
ncbi:hypothetical protein C8F04DRAFT_1125522 [Mycena alexandri]|uniref:F-box domain-containing protein n=1 Tax=Mycena alexandri TaxID=1745969 RepID=A0AAD6SJ13_9AGAR|nr:hypothetical protein C8F04DRAFT_1125522 [Mycena alexandri]